MEEKEIKRKSKDFKREFNLSNAGLTAILKPGTPGFEKRIRRMDRILEEARKCSNISLLVRIILFWFAYPSLLVEGRFDKAIEDIIEFRAKDMKTVHKVIADLKKKGKIK